MSEFYKDAEPIEIHEGDVLSNQDGSHFVVKLYHLCNDCDEHVISNEDWEQGVRRCGSCAAELPLSNAGFTG